VASEHYQAFRIVIFGLSVAVGLLALLYRRRSFADLGQGQVGQTSAHLFFAASLALAHVPNATPQVRAIRANRSRARMFPPNGKCWKSDRKYERPDATLFFPFTHDPFGHVKIEALLPRRH